MEPKTPQEQLQELLAERDRLLVWANEPVTRRGRQATPKKWEVVIYDASGAVQVLVNKGKVVELVKTFDRSQEADQWAALKLTNNGAAGWYATISLTGTHISTRMDRDPAMDRIMNSHRPGPAFHQKSGRFGTLGFGVKAHQTRVEFSRG